MRRPGSCSLHRSRASAALALAAALVLGAAAPPQSTQARSLQGAPWVVRDVNGEPVPPGARATMVFGADGRLTGSSFCNSYSGTYSTTGEEITIGQTIVTRKACPPEVMKLEQAFLAVLRGTTRFAVKAGALSLRGTGSSALTAQR